VVVMPQVATESKIKTKSIAPQLPAIIPAKADAPKPEKDDQDFDWLNDDSVVLREQPETAIYFNKQGTLVIRQRRWPDEDSFVYIAETNIGAFLDKITDVCGVPSFGGPG
jgi:hypothetical protein